MSEKKVTFDDEVKAYSPSNPVDKYDVDSAPETVTKFSQQKALEIRSFSKLQDPTPGPNLYHFDIWNLYKGPSTSFKGRRLDLFNTQKDTVPASYYDLRYMRLQRQYKPLSYYINPVDNHGKGVSMKGDRRTLFNDAKKNNAVFLLPRLCNSTPGPGSYNLPSTFNKHKSLAKLAKRKKAKVALSFPPASANYSTQKKNSDNYVYYFSNPAVAFKSSRSYNFQQVQRPNGTVDLVKEMDNDTPGPGAYDIQSSIGTGVSFGPAKETHIEVVTDDIDGTNEEDDNLDDVRPAGLNLSYYSKLPAIGKSKERVQDSEERREDQKRPGPSDYTLTKSNLKKSPAFSNRKKTKPSYPDSLNYVSKVGNPAPNAYKAEQHNIPGSRKPPSFSMGKRFEHPESKVSPGPAAYEPKLVDSGAPKYTMTSRANPNKVIAGPAANTYSPQSDFAKANVTLKSRASPYVYSGFRSTKIAEPVGNMLPTISV